MAEITQRDGTWSFDGETLRLVPGHSRGVHPLRTSLGEVAVPLAAIAALSWERGRKGGRLRLRLRDGADPLSQAARGHLPDSADPYQLAVAEDRTGAAEVLAEEVRRALLLAEVPDGPCTRYLLPGPNVPLTASGTDGTATFDGERVVLRWNWLASERKRALGDQELPLSDLVGVEWTPAIGLENGSLRFRVTGASPAAKPEHDPHSLVLWGVRHARETSGALLAAAVLARLPHPLGGAASERSTSTEQPAPPPAEAAGGPSAGDSGEDHDVLLRRLRELGELHREGVLTAEEFAAAKKAVLDRF